ncbi:MAG: mandelate racemase/muconate lactonizing enzyme family protein [Dehalococcoidia bacterium]
MKITKVDVQVLVWPPFDPPFWMSLVPVTTAHELVVRIHTEDGLVGLGHTDQLPGIFTTDRSGNFAPGNAAGIVPGAIAPLLVGQDALEHERLWSDMFRLTYQKNWSGKGWSRRQIMASIAAVDMALWDLKAKALGLPVYRLLGTGSNRVPCYLAGGYYRDGKSLDHLVSECGKYARQGFKALKMRVGGMTLEEDVERVAAVREAVGPDMKLMLDVNEAYDSQEAIRAAELYTPSDIFWFEEPAHWYEGYSGLRRVADTIDIPLAGGEQCETRWDAAEMVEQSGIRFMEFDCMRTGGPSEWLKVAAVCSAKGIPMAPHHGPHIHAHLVAAVPNGTFVEVFPDPFTYPDQDELQYVRWDKKREMFATYPETIDGDMVLPDTPGWGIELDEDTIQKRTIWQT